MADSPLPTASSTTTSTTITLSSGGRAHIWHPAAHPARATIVLQHGYGEYASRYETSHHNLIGHFLQAGYAVYALDLWGHGESPGPRGVVHIGRAVRDHLELRQYAASREVATQPTVLFGHSLGGLVTAGSVVVAGGGEEAGPRVSGVVMTGPAFPERVDRMGRWVLGVVAAAVPWARVPRQREPVEGLTRVPEEVEKYWADGRFHKDGLCFLLAATAVDVMEGVRRGWGRWVVPTLVLHGKADVYCDWKASEEFVAGIASKEKALQAYEEGRHELLHDLDGSAVLKQVLQWIERQIEDSLA